MKSHNFRAARLDGAMQMLHKLFLQKKQTAVVNREQRRWSRQQRWIRWGGSGASGSGARERARRIRQMAAGMNCGQFNFRTNQQRDTA